MGWWCIPSLKTGVDRGRRHELPRGGGGVQERGGHAGALPVGRDEEQRDVVAGVQMEHAHDAGPGHGDPGGVAGAMPGEERLGPGETVEQGPPRLWLPAGDAGVEHGAGEGAGLVGLVAAEPAVFDSR